VVVHHPYPLLRASLETLLRQVDGIEAAANIRERFGIRSIFFSGYLDRETRDYAAGARPIALLDKTATQEDFAHVLSTVAEKVATT